METIQKFNREWRCLTKGVLLLILCLSLNLRSYSACDCIIRNAEKEVGVRENGKNNSGKRIAEYLNSVNIKTPSAWCAAFVAFILTSCDIKHTITAWSPSATSKNRIYDRRYPSKNTITPQAGDVGTLYYPSLKRIGHAFFITSWGSKWVNTIEGNTSEADTRETTTGKDGVFRKKRLRTTIYQVSRWR